MDVENVTERPLARRGSRRRADRAVPEVRDLCHINMFVRHPLLRRMVAAATLPIERFLHLHQLNAVYRALQEGVEGATFCERVLNAMNLRYAVEPGQLARIPLDVPVVAVANHPFGGVEGVILGDMLLKVRPDVRIMANYLLKHLEQGADEFIFVDPYETSGAVRRNMKPLRETIRWLRQGGAVAIFPAGDVSRLHLRERQVRDPEWNERIGRIARDTGAWVVPVYFEGANSLLFQALGMIHPRLRTVLLPREMMKKSGHTVTVKVGDAIPPETLRRFPSDRSLTAYLRLRTHLLHGLEGTHRGAGKTTGVSVAVPVVEPVDPAAIDSEIKALPEDQVLLTSGPYHVIWATARQAPMTVYEIGRLRELTFRATGEGTGWSIDLDGFDDTYHHLLLWHAEQRLIIGAYRLGIASDILGKHGVKGLYTSTLFRFRPGIVKQLRHGLEMGRSFVRPEYQKKYSSLLLLWQGIGRFIVRHPNISTVFGAVSISNEYHSLSQQLIVSFCTINTYLGRLARMVKPRHPFRRPRWKGLSPKLWKELCQDLEQVSAIIGDIEEDHKGIPILIRQYLKMGGGMVAFNRDNQFSNVLDGLMVVDLRDTDPKLLVRYMGADGARDFCRRHGLPAP